MLYATAGVKTENEGWVQSRLAALCLQQGLNLQHATEFTDALIPRVGAKALLQVLSKPPSAAVWAEVKVIAQTAKIEVPEVADLQLAAEVRLRKAAAKQKLRSPPEIVAADVSVLPGFFKNQDESDAQVLEQLRPGVSGLLLVDIDRAGSILRTVTTTPADELAILVLGHRCPCKASCDGLVSFPAVCRSSGSRVLLAACLHNLKTPRSECPCRLMPPSNCLQSSTVSSRLGPKSLRN